MHIHAYLYQISRIFIAKQLWCCLSALLVLGCWEWTCTWWQLQTTWTLTKPCNFQFDYKTRHHFIGPLLFYSNYTNTIMCCNLRHLRAEHGVSGKGVPQDQLWSTCSHGGGCNGETTLNVRFLKRCRWMVVGGRASRWSSSVGCSDEHC